MPVRAARVAGAALLALTTTACGSSGSSGAAAGKLDWQSCYGGFECTTLGVPNDYGNPGAGEQHIALARARAESSEARRGVLLYNLGGPGETGASAIRAIDAMLERVAPELTRQFDLVGFDPRGIGASTPALHYLDDDTLDRIRALPATVFDAETLAERDAVADEVLSEAGRLDPDFATHVDSESVARDMDRIRDALGESSLNYYGGSYGTLLGALYATLFPDRVRAFVLDSAVGPVIDREAVLLGQTRGYEEALAEFAAWCVDAPDCPLATFGDDAAIVRAVRALVAAADAAPMVVGERVANGSDLVTALMIGLGQGSAGWRRLASTIAELSNGDASFALAQADAYDGRGDDGHYDDDIVDANLAIQALDAPYPNDFTRAEFDAWAASDVTRAGATFGPFLSGGERLTLGWPFRRAEPLMAVDGRAAPPLLILAGAHDPATPPDWGAALRDALGNGTAIVTLEDGAHGQLFASDCVREVAVPFFLDPTEVPSDSACTAPPP